MQEKQNLVQEALLQMKNVEEAIAQNAKGILASTMKEEINQLVKESLSEQDDEIEVDADVKMSKKSDDLDDIDTDNEDEEEDVNFDMPSDSEETPIDLTDASDEEILKVFKAMGEEDGIIVKKDGEDIHLTDNDADTEYLVKLGESEEDLNSDEMKLNEIDEMSDNKKTTQDVIDAIFSNDGGNVDFDEKDTEEVMFEIDFEDDDQDSFGEGSHYNLEEEDDEEKHIEEEDNEEKHIEEDDDDNEDDVVYEIQFDDEEEFSYEDDEFHSLEEEDDQDNDDSLEEAYNHKKAHKGSKKSETKEGKKMSVKPKGVGIGSGPKFKYDNKSKGGFDEDKKEGPKSVGTGKPKFEYKKGANMDGKSKVVKKAETKERARTLGSGSRFREGGLPKPYAYSEFNANIKKNVKESLESEVLMLREKNEEYRKALNVFREKLNEVAIFNSNLAYATRLFTEHSTTKKEKINILRRFDDVESLKESKSLYRSIKDELNKTESKSINESVEKKINNTVSSGSATNLIESKTYENPQFLRMKDLMSKLR